MFGKKKEDRKPADDFTDSEKELFETFQKKKVDKEKLKKQLEKVQEEHEKEVSDELLKDTNTD